MQAQDTEKKASARNQYFSALCVNLGSFTIGNSWSWSSTALPALDIEDTWEDPLSKTQRSLVAAVIFLGAALACPLVGLLAEKKGLRFSMLSLTLPLILGWLLIAFATNFEMVLIGRIVTGFCSGGVGLTAPAFVGETTTPSIRGKLSFAYFFNFSCGVLYIFVVGSWLSFRWQSLACIIPVIFFHALVYFIPDSPRDLIKFGMHSKATKALMWFRMRDDPKHREIEAEMKEIEASIQTGSSSITNVKFDRTLLHPIAIAIGLQVLLQLCGEVPVLAFTVDIFKAAGSSFSHFGTMIVGVTQVVMAVLGSFFVDRFGRKSLLIISELFMAISLFVLGGFFYAKNFGLLSDIVQGNEWIAIACLVVFISAFAIGVGPIPWVSLGELINPESKGFSSAVITMVNRALGFLAAFFFEDMTTLLGDHGCYWLFAAINVFGIVFVWLFVPETKGKTLSEIQNKLSKNWIFACNKK